MCCNNYHCLQCEIGASNFGLSQTLNLKRCLICLDCSNFLYCDLWGYKYLWKCWQWPQLANFSRTLRGTLSEFRWTKGIAVWTDMQTQADPRNSDILALAKNRFSIPKITTSNWQLIHNKIPLSAHKFWDVSQKSSNHYK